jgi:hypothetical protein
MLHSYALRALVSFRDCHETHNIYFAQALLCVYLPVGACGKFQMYVYIYVCMSSHTYVCIYVCMYLYTHFRHQSLAYIFMYISFISIYMSLHVWS